MLPRVLGPFDAITIVVGSIIGSGIFLKASRIAEDLGQQHGFVPIIMVWAVVGFVTLCGSLALGELAAMLPQAGGPYVYLREAYGRLWAFLWGWTEFWIVRTGSLGALACATVIYGNSFLETLKEQHLLPGLIAALVPLTHWAQCAVSVMLVLACTCVNVIGTKSAARLQNVTTIIKVGFLAFLIVGPFVTLQADTRNLAPLGPTDFSLVFWRAIGLATIAVLWPYDGWINIAPVAEEIKQPQRNVPLALTVGMLIIITVYLGANLSYHLMLPMDKVAQSPAVATEVCKMLIGSAGAWVAALCVMVSTFGALNSNLLCGPRIYFAMARDRLFPAAIRQVHSRFQTPANAIMAQSAWSLVLILVAYAWTAWSASGGSQVANEESMLPAPASPGDAFDVLTDFVIFGGSIFYAMAVGAVFVLRWKKPNLARPYRTWGYPVTPALYLLAFSGALVSMLVDKFEQTIAGSVLILAGVVAFFVMGGGRKSEP
ncbi:MAG: amino acid permease [Planctomycetaceae bacterium]|nr:amino acid permease [Planctomycetaceae bacterium]